MTSAPRALGPPDSSELLERAVGYTRGCLALVRAEALDLPTPCALWNLRRLLRHMDDALAAMAEAARSPVLALAPAYGPDDGAELLESIRQRACSLLAEWTAHSPPDEAAAADDIRLGGMTLDRATLGAVGALEITLHGWDVARACRADRPVPPELARDLWPLAVDHIDDRDRPERFGPVVAVPPWAGPATRLLAHAGRHG
jgi:uncharacterized protein (TIGR03086 family)